MTDPGQLNQVVDEPCGQRARCDAPGWNAIGIEPETRGLIFDPFSPRSGMPRVQGSVCDKLMARYDSAAEELQ